MDTCIEYKVAQFNINKNQTLCFTGHRSQHLPWKFNENAIECKKMKATLKKEIEESIKSGYTTFLCGMALGFDLICAETVLELKSKYNDIKLIAVIPCDNQQIKWPLKDQIRYSEIIKNVDAIRQKYKTYNGNKCMLERNRFMIDNSSMVIALFNGQNGGTKYTLDYAMQNGLSITIIEP